MIFSEVLERSNEYLAGLDSLRNKMLMMQFCMQETLGVVQSNKQIFRVL